ncbi:MAG: hypothetical protein KKC64_02725, partial [Spirochaetes bacterium]|nr:hypothetical protein [Spirochaetota bacterium]
MTNRMHSSDITKVIIISFMFIFILPLFVFASEPVCGVCGKTPCKCQPIIHHCNLCGADYTGAIHVCPTAACSFCKEVYYLHEGHTCPKPPELGAAKKDVDAALKELELIEDDPPLLEADLNDPADNLGEDAREADLAANAAQDVADDQLVVNGANQEQAGAANSNMQQPAIADPVQPASGTYVHNETDLQLANGAA